LRRKVGGEVFPVSPDELLKLGGDGGIISHGLVGNHDAFLAARILVHGRGGKEVKCPQYAEEKIFGYSKGRRRGVTAIFSFS